MGKIIYGATRTEIQLDDRTMAHLQAVVATKLRRGEGFFLNWHDDPSVGDGHSAAWIGPNRTNQMAKAMAAMPMPTRIQPWSTAFPPV